MESPRNNVYQEANEMTFKEIIIGIQQWVKFLWGKRLIILLFTAAGVGGGLILALISKPRYKAELTFVLEDSKPTALGAYAGLANQFGIDLGTASESGIFSGDNILEFLKSRLMIEKALLSPVLRNGKVQSLADYYLEIDNSKEKWKKNSGFENISFPVSVDRRGFTRQHDSILSVIYDKIGSENLVISKPDKKLSFILVECISEDELFSKLFIERLVKEATDFYIHTKLQRSKVIVDKLQIKADSIESLLNRKTYSVAESQDLNLNPARSMAGVRTELVARDKLVLQTMYGEVVKNLELSRMTMAQETPIIQIVDNPVLPLKKSKLGVVKGIVLGGILAGFLVGIFLIIGRMYKTIMS